MDFTIQISCENLGTFLEQPTADSDVLNLDTSDENVYLFECLRIAAAGTRNKEVLEYAETELYGNARKVGLYARYKERNPEETIRQQTQHRRLGYTKK